MNSVVRLQGMPASPSTRISPGRGLRTENHKRGRSLESGIRCQEKDDDLALFNEVQNKERENFLLQSNDDFDDHFSTKLRSFSDYKLGISIPARGESSDLLNAEEDKNDYDWLITPPETPLFPSLDDESSPISLSPRGRPRSQPISISRSSTMEKGYRSARGSASPHRLSPSPRSSNSPLQPRSRPFSATHSSPPPSLRHSSPSRRLSPPPSKLTPAPRSGTPTPRRVSAGAAGANAPSRARGTSPLKTARGNSASPKVKAWQSSIPGFSSEAPPNLRTSLADRPASYVRGSSPASRNSSKYGRQSMSPTASKSISSSHSQEEQFSSYGRGSVVSSGDDDVDSQQSNPISSSDRPVPRNTSAFPSNRAMGFSKKPTKILSSSAPKRSFELALRQMEWKGPQNMFRPLLSSVPSSTFYVGKVNAHHPPLKSRNSSITTSSNASSDQGMSGALDPEESEQNQVDVTSDFVMQQCPTVHDEVFVMDQAEAANGGVENRTVEESSGSQLGENDHSTVIPLLRVDERLSTATVLDSIDVVLNRKHDSSNVHGTRDMRVCSKCSQRFPSSELVMEGDLWLCHECKCLEVNPTEIIHAKPIVMDENNTEDFVQTLECGMLEVSDQSVIIPQSLLVTRTVETGTDHLESIANSSQQSYSEPSKDLPTSLTGERGLTFGIQKESKHSLDGDTGRRQLQQSGGCSNLNVNVSEGTGISLLLKRSSSSKGHIVQSKSLTASNISYDDFSYVGDSLNSTRSSIGRSSASMSSSVDLGSSWQTEIRMHRQSSGKKYDLENYRHETPSKHKRSISSLSGASGHVFQVSSVTPSCFEDAFEVIAPNKDKEIREVICADPHDQSLASEWTEAESTCTDVESSNIFKTTAELSSQWTDEVPGGTPVASILISEEPASHENGDKLTENSSNSMNEKTSSAHLQTSTLGEDATENSRVNTVHVGEVPPLSSLDAISEIEIENPEILSADSQSNADSPNSKNCMSELLEPSVSVAGDDVKTAVGELDTSVPVNGVFEESTIVLEGQGGTKSRSLTLEEATDAILFCSSIVHNLAHEAANIAIDKENSSVELKRPTVTFVGKSNTDRRNMRLRPLGKRSSKSQKTRQRRMERDSKPHAVVAETDEKSTQRTVRSPSKGDSMNPPKLESKCNCTIM